MPELNDQPPNPYVGPRPFEETDSDYFFGRNAEIRRLLHLLLADRIVLLYSPSGAGKTSLIRAGLISGLKKEKFHVWPPVLLSRKPSKAQHGSIRKNRYIEATLLSLEQAIPDEAQAVRSQSSSLNDYFKALSSHSTPRYEILIFDQFEEVLSLDRSDFDAKQEFFRELGQALKADHRWALFAMREDYIAALEPYLKWIPTRLSSTLRLDLLRQPQAELAIREPALRQDVLFTDQAVTGLVNNLRGATDGRPGSPYVEPVLLQVVCANLWETVSKDQKEITNDMLEGLGDIDSALSDYYAQAVAGAAEVSGVPERRIREWFESQLITPEGIRSQIQTGPGKTSNERTQAVKSLVNNHLVRVEERVGTEWLELAHDRLVAPILRHNRRWREEYLEPFQRAAIIWDKEGRPTSRYLLTRQELADAKRWQSTHMSEMSNREHAFLRASRSFLRRRLLRGAGIVSAMLFASISFLVVKQVQERLIEREMTVGALSGLDKNSSDAENRFDQVAYYLLNATTDAKHFDDLKDLLEGHEEFLPAAYGVDRSGLEHFTPVQGEWPLEIHYSELRNLDESYFSLHWQRMAKFFSESWGFPVPKRVKLISETTYPKDLVTFHSLAAQNTIPRRFNLPAYENQVLISTRGMRGPTRKFFDRFKEHWTEIEEVSFRGPWYAVPRWSLPVWKVSGHDAVDGSGFAAFFLSLKLQQDPEPLISDSAVEVLLRRFEPEYPQTVAEARAARGPNLRHDLIHLVKLGSGLKHLDVLLDALARYPNMAAEDAAYAAYWDVQSTLASLPDSLHGPWEAAVEGSNANNSGAPEWIDSKRAAEAHQEAYREVDEWLPPVELQIRVHVGERLKRKWFPGNQFSPTLAESLESLRDDLIRRFGITMPGIQFYGHSSDGELPSDSFRIEALNQTATRTEPISEEPEYALTRLIDELEIESTNLRVYWLTAENVHWNLEKMEPALRKWLREHYSSTDLKLLLRAVIDPTIDEFALSGHPRHINSVRHLDWLLGSLVFWSNIENSKDFNALAEKLRETVEAHAELAYIGAAATTVTQTVDRGVQMMQAGQISDAESAFAKAVKADSQSTKKRFLIAYAAILESSIRRALDKACELPIAASLTPAERINLEDLLAELRQDLRSEDDRRLTLCLRVNTVDQMPRKQESLTDELLENHFGPQEWPPREAVWLAQDVLNSFNPIEDDDLKRERAIALLRSAIVRLDERESYETFLSLVDICTSTGPMNWCWKAMDEIGRARPSKEIALELAFQLSHREHQQDLEKALQWADLADELIRKAEMLPEHRKWATDVISFSKIKARATLTSLDDKQDVAELENAFRNLLDSLDVGTLAVIELTDLLLQQERLSEAESFLTASLDNHPQETTLYLLKVFTQLSMMNVEGAAATATEVLAKAGTNRDTLFVAALGQILTQEGPWELRAREFLATDHEYVPYVAMILYAYLGGEDEAAIRLLERRWQLVEEKQNPWIERVRAGDATAWRDMLIGHFLNRSVGQVTFPQIITELEDSAAYSRSDYRHLPMARRELLCESYFYDAMLAKAKHRRPHYLAGLNKVIGINCRRFLEYKMAKFLLQRENSSPTIEAAL